MSKAKDEPKSPQIINAFKAAGAALVKGISRPVAKVGGRPGGSEISRVIPASGRPQASRHEPSQGSKRSK